MPFQRIFGFLRSWRIVGGIAGMAFVSQAINFLISLVLPRLYTDVSFGELGLFLAVVLVMAEMINLRLDIALNTTKDREDAMGICRVAIRTGLMVAVSVGAVCLLVKTMFPDIVLHPLAVTVALSLYAIHQPTFWMLNREGRFAVISIFRVVQVLITGGVTIALALSGWTTNGLIDGFCAGLAVAALGQWWIVQRIGGRMTVPVHSLPGVISRFRQFWMFGTWSALFNNLSRQLPIYFLQWGFGLSTAGQYTMGTRLLNAPVWTVSGALGQYFVRQAIHMDNATLLQWVRKTLLAGMAISIFPSLVLLLFGEPIFAFLFGADWAEAGRMVQWLILWYMVSFTIGPVTQVLDLRGKLKFEFWYNLLLMSARAVSLGVGWWMGSYKVALLLFVATGIVFNLWQWLYIENILKRPDGDSLETAG
jgi:lipopolysaccharide exporter